MPKIIYLITKSHWGGAQKYVYDLAVEAKRRDFQVVVALGEGEELALKLMAKNIPIISLPRLGRNIKIWSDLLIFFNLIKLFRQNQPDIIHLNSSKIGGLGALAGRIAGMPKIIFTGHGWAFNEKRFFLNRWLIAFSHWLTIILCHRVIAVSQQTARQVSILPGVKNKIEIIYNGLEPIIFLPKHEARAQLSPADTDTIWLGTVAELHKNKGLDILLLAFKEVLERIPGLNLIIIGEGEERANLARLIARNRLTENVRLLGRVPDAAKYFYAFDLFVLPSRTEALPYVILEAGLAGLPVIASHVGGIPEIIKHSVFDNFDNLVPPENPEALARAIEGLLINKNLAAQLGQALRQKVTVEFSKQKMLEQTFALYSKN